MMRVEREAFGTAPDGRPVERFTLHGPLTIRIMTYGATVTELHAPDREGHLADVVLGFDRFEPYLAARSYFGATIGRVANRIAGSEFMLDGTGYPLPANEGAHHLHGGPCGFDRALWTAEAGVGTEGISVRFRHVSPDGDQGYPGRMEAIVRMTLSAGSEFGIEYEARVDRPCPVNLTHHSYFNLAGAGSGDIGSHLLTLHADRYLPVDKDRVPTGEIRPVAGSPFDFRSGAAMGARRALLPFGGYDHNFVNAPEEADKRPAGGPDKRPAGGPWQRGFRRVAEVVESSTGRVLTVSSTEPGLQFYDGNFLDGSITGLGGNYGKFGAFCLEAQGFPDAVHHPRFPSVVLRPGEVYRQRTVYRFSLMP